ncbi:MAG: hypothetical protein ACI9WU_005228, partial [Myxococcota bacterium]
DTATPDTPEAPPAPPLFDQDWAELTRGVTTLETGEAIHSPIAVHGTRAFSVLPAAETAQTFVAAAHHGQGRVVAFGHDRYLGAAVQGADDTGRLTRNAVWWAAGRSTELDEPGGPTVAANPGVSSSVTTFLEAQGATIVTGATTDADVLLVAATPNLSEQQRQAIGTFVADGGGLLVAGSAWWWSYSHADVAGAFPGNLLLNFVGGLTWTEDTDLPTGTHTVPDAAPGPLYHGRWALNALAAHQSGEAPLTDDQIRVAVTGASAAIRGLPLSVEDYFDAALSIAADIGQVVIGPEVPIHRDNNPIKTLVVTLDDKLLMNLPADELWAHPGADVFPGALPASAVPEVATITVDGSYEAPHEKYAFGAPLADVMRSTGVYAAPGEVITVTLPAGSATAGLGILIGCHTDSLWGRDEWRRNPRVARRWVGADGDNAVGNGWGGLVYITVPTGSTLGQVSVTVKGAYSAPRWVQGVSTPETWLSVRDAPAPWAEIGSDKMILSVPSELIRQLDDPGALAAFWDQAMDAAADLSALPQQRARPERFALDEQISVGWMHSGYPLMAHLPSAPEMVDLEHMSTLGSWGPFHEIGHNHQYLDWVLPGTVESSVNLFSTYIFETVVGITDDGHEMITPAKRAETLQSHVDAGLPLDGWSVWVALETYLQLKDFFGWQLYKDVFAEYRLIPASQAPDTDAARFNQWLTRLSLHAGRDLGPFFQAWNLPVASGALAQSGQLPTWLEDPMRTWFPVAAIVETTDASSVEGTESWSLGWDIIDPGQPGATAQLLWGDEDAGTDPADWDHTMDLGAALAGAGSAVVDPEAGSMVFWRVAVTNDLGTYVAPTAGTAQPAEGD